jgi:hypothetical protein
MDDFTECPRTSSFLSLTRLEYGGCGGWAIHPLVTTTPFRALHSSDFVAVKRSTVLVVGDKAQTGFGCRL